MNKHAMRASALKILLLPALMLFFATNLCAQNASSQNREQWMSEVRQFKRSFISKELNLTKEQQNKFFPLYEEMDEKTTQIDNDARTMEKHIAENADASELEYEKAAEVLYDAKVQQAQVEREYMEKFKTILTKKQLFELKSVERQFSRELMKQHQRIRSKRDAPAQ